jgi:PAS domain S-box-containing protein
VKELQEALELLSVVAYAGLAVIAFAQWLRQRSRAAAWLAATFGTIGGVSLAGRVLPEDHRWTQIVLVGLLVLFPYFLYRFMATFVPQRRVVEVGAAALTALTVLSTLLIDDLDTDQPSFRMLVFLVLLGVQWGSLSLLVALNLWRGGRNQPTVARRRMQVLALGATGLVLAIVLAVLAAPADDPAAIEIVVQLLGLSSAVLFLLGFAPPAFVRYVWRKPEARRLAEAELELMEAITPAEVADVLLPRVCELLAARGAVLVDADGAVIGVHGLTRDEAEETVAHLSADEKSRLKVPLATGVLTVELSPFTPYFGRDETGMLRSLATLAALALARAELLQRERESRAQLIDAQRLAGLGSWEWDLRTGSLTRSEELYRIYGSAPEDLPTTYPAMIELASPDDRARIEKALRRAVEEGAPFDTEFEFERPDGTRVVLHSRGRVIRDATGDPIKIVGTAQDITQRKRQEEFRDRFIADAAHELRTPLTTLVGFIELLDKRRSSLSEERLEAIMTQLTLAGARMSDLVNNLLDLSRMQQGQLRLRPEEVAIGPQARELLKSLPPPEGTQVDVRIGNGARALVDRHALDQVLANLLTNAYRYGGRRVIIDAHDDGEGVVLSVSDDGPGVDQSLLPHLFDPFARGPTASRAGGSGLGLAIIKSLVEASGGEIWHAPVSPTGTSFNVRLPTSR